MAGRTELVTLLRATLDGATSQNAWNKLVECAESPPNLSGIDLAGNNLVGLSFRGCVLDGSRLEDCGLVGVNFDEASLVRATLRGSVLRQASLVRARATQADLRDCDVVGTDFSWCDLKDALLDGLDLSKAILWKTDLRGASYRPFTASRKQHFITEEGQAFAEVGDEMVPLPRLLQVLGAMIGTPYRWMGGQNVPNIELPERVDHPEALLDQVLHQLGLQSEPKTNEVGHILYYAVTAHPRQA